MKVKVDSTKWFEAMDSWLSMCQHQAAKPYSSKANKAYYELYAKYYERLVPATERGDTVVHPTSVPTEIFYAMDLVPMLVTSSTGQMVYSLKNFVEVLDLAKDFGIMEESCSVHRMIAVFALKGWFPKPAAFVYAVGGCDSFCGSSRVLSEVYDVPSFCIDTPYYYSEEGIAYLTRELTNMVQFLEENTGRKMDWDRLKESLKISEKQHQLFQEIRQLRKAIPSPMESRRAWQLNWMNWIYAGSEDGVYFFTTLRDELKERVEQGKGAAPEEKFRLLDLTMAPAHAFSLLDWMQEKRGASIVSEPVIRYERDFSIDPDKPIESLARKWCGGPLWNELQGSTESISCAAIEDAQEYQAEGAIWWDHNACRQCGAISMTKDELLSKLDIPMVEIKCDITDPTFISYDEMKKDLEDFLELLEARKKG